MYPPPLKKGDTIGVVTLGSPAKEEELNRGTAVLNNMGYHVLLGNYALSQNFPATTATHRAQDLMEMFLNPSVKMILGLRGGTGVADILPLLDYSLIRLNPKILAGYSDLSILLNVITQFTGLVTFNAPMLLDIHAETPPFNLEHFLKIISLARPYSIKNPAHMPFISKVKGTAIGPLAGGNLTSIIGSLATPFEINTKGKILFLEDINESSTRVYRLLTHLLRAGKFHDVSGIIIGECTNCKTEYNTTYEQVIEKLLVPLGKPLLMNLATGHGKYKVTIPIGSVGRLDTDRGTITIL